MADSAEDVVLNYCAAVRGILNDDQGGPLQPPGLRMAEALNEVRESIQRNLDEENEGFAANQLDRLADCVGRGLDEVKEVQETIREYVKDVAEIAATLEPGTEDCTDREEKFETIIDRFERTDDPIRHHMIVVMLSFLPGLFVGEGKFEEIKDNLDLERWFRLPKSHERRIHGHRHAGIRIVLEGPTLVHALDARMAHTEPFSPEDLLPYRTAQPSRRARRRHESPHQYEKGEIPRRHGPSSPCRTGAALSRIFEVLALLRAVEKKRLAVGPSKLLEPIASLLRKRTLVALDPMVLFAARFKPVLFSVLFPENTWPVTIRLVPQRRYKSVLFSVLFSRTL